MTELRDRLKGVTCNVPPPTRSTLRFKLLTFSALVLKNRGTAVTPAKEINHQLLIRRPHTSTQEP